MTGKHYIQAVFFIVAVIFTILNIEERFLTKKVKMLVESFLNCLLLYQTTVRYLTRKLSEMRFPLLLTFYATPGYDINLLGSFGFHSERQFFAGKMRVEDDTTHINWGNETHSVQGSTSPGSCASVLNHDLQRLFSNPSSISWT